jgi:hypothetical protein
MNLKREAAMTGWKRSPCSRDGLEAPRFRSVAAAECKTRAGADVRAGTTREFVHADPRELIHDPGEQQPLVLPLVRISREITPIGRVDVEAWALASTATDGVMTRTTSNADLRHRGPLTAEALSEMERGRPAGVAEAPHYASDARVHGDHPAGLAKNGSRRRPSSMTAPGLEPRWPGLPPRPVGPRAGCPRRPGGGSRSRHTARQRTRALRRGRAGSGRCRCGPRGCSTWAAVRET